MRKNAGITMLVIGTIFMLLTVLAFSLSPLRNTTGSGPVGPFVAPVLIPTVLLLGFGIYFLIRKKEGKTDAQIIREYHKAESEKHEKMLKDQRK